jgi:hypothetical protein
MIRKKHAAVLVSLGMALALLALSSIPARANDLVMASVTATCSGYTVSVAGVNGDTPGLSVSFSFTLTPTPGSPIGPITGTVPTADITVNPSNFDFSGSVTNPWPAGAFTTNFSFTISGTATLHTSSGTGNTVPISATGSLVCAVANQCPLTQGFWKNHPAAWPVTSLTLGSVSYNQAQLITILKTPVAGDASINLAHQLIAAMLNVANLSNPAPISATITDANGDLDGGIIPQGIAPSSTLGADMVGDASTLDSYNSGTLTPSCTGPS